MHENEFLVGYRNVELYERRKW